MTDDDYFEALRSRDTRFDGKFFVGVKTTGIYCRPICPARPKRENVEFFKTADAAVRAGYRACRRCRPEVSPTSAAWKGSGALVERAVRQIGDEAASVFDEENLARRCGVTARHLRRLFTNELGRTPKQVADEARLQLARSMLRRSNLTMTEVALAAGFGSVRRFNGAFAKRFGRRPGEVRRAPLARDAGWVITLPYRPPFHFAALLAHYASYRVGRLEAFTDHSMRRLVEFGGRTGWIEIANDGARDRLRVAIDFDDVTALPAICARVRAMFDLDVDPLAVKRGLDVNAAFREMMARHEGLRMPTGWDPFEIGVTTILGQLVSVACARSLTAKLIELLGRDSGLTEDGHAIKLFPMPRAIAASGLAGLGTTGARKQTLREFSRRVASGELSLAATQDPEEFIARLRTIKGIGPWTAVYLAMKVLRHADAFPETDLILARALENHAPADVARIRPWRAYAAILLWREWTTRGPAKVSRTRSKA